MTAAVTDYTDITTDLANFIRTNVTDFDHVGEEELDINGPLTLHHRRTADVQLMEADDEVMAGNEYTTVLTFNVLVAAFDMASYRDAARVRNDLVQALKLQIRRKPKFSADVLATITGRTVFAQDNTERGFIALAVVEIRVQAYEGAC